MCSRETAAPWGTPEETDIDTAIMVQTEIARLDNALRSVVTLRMSGFTLAEIGEINGYTRQRAHALFDRALRDLRQNIRKADIA